MSAAENQLMDFKKHQKTAVTATAASGAPMPVYAPLTVGPRGPVLLQDVNLVDEIAHFTRERIPERVVHAKGAGAHGFFEVTHDITKYCSAKLFSEIGKRTPMVVRFSTVGGESGSADTLRDPRGFALKFYTEEGVWDMAGNNTPIFFIRDPMLFPSFIHTQKRNPETHLKDPDMFWDFISLRPETTQQTLFHFSDRGIPDGYRHMNGYGSHTYKFINDKAVAHYVKFHFKTAQGIKNLPANKADELLGTDPDYSIRDLYNAIASGNYPSWNMFIQVMTFDQAEKHHQNPFDLTKVWSQKEYPLIPVGRFTLDRNPKNYFTDVEMAAYSPSNLVPGIDISPDKMLQARIFAYDDTHRHRLGANFKQLPINCPFRSNVKNYHRDGPMNFTDNQSGAPNYFPNSFEGPKPTDYARKLQPAYRLTGDVHRYEANDEDDFSQSQVFWNQVLDGPARKRLITNMAKYLAKTQGFIQERAIANFAKVSPELGKALTEEVNAIKSAKL